MLLNCYWESVSSSRMNTFVLYMHSIILTRYKFGHITIHSFSSVHNIAFIMQWALQMVSDLVPANGNESLNHTRGY